MNQKTFFTWFTTLIALYQIGMASNVMTWFGVFIPSQVHRAVSLLCVMILVFLLFRIRSKHGFGGESETGEEQTQHTSKVPWYDWLLIASAAISLGFVILNYDQILRYATFGNLDAKGVVFALMLCIPLLEAVRRMTGLVFPILILCVVMMTMFQQFLPGILYGVGYPLDRLLFGAFVGTNGIFGLPLNVASTIIIVFLIFGAFLQQSGAGKWFMDLAMALTGRYRGGPAKAAVLSSAMFGSISGSPTGNVATTGVFTIPLMIRIGYKPAYAGAVEAVASTGGQILPPIMGAIAFIMAEWIGVSYADVVIAAVIPAILYFLIAFFSVHFQARKQGIESIPAEQIPRIWPVFVQGWYYLIPLLLLVYFLIVMKYPPAMSGIYALPFLLASSFLSKDRTQWLTWKKIVKGFESAIKGWLVIVTVTASIGIMVGAFEMSGVGIKVSRFIIDLSGGDLYLTLLLVGISSLILGMGLDAIPAYFTLASLVVPALITIGVPDIAAHLFVIYWGLASFITPPVCISVFVACTISKSKVWETGWHAVRIGIAAYLIPFAFVLNDGLRLQGSLSHIALATSTALIGAVLVAAAVQGFFIRSMDVIQRVVLFAAGILFIAPGVLMPLIGLVLAVCILAWQRIAKSNTSQKVAA